MAALAILAGWAGGAGAALPDPAGQYPVIPLTLTSRGYKQAPVTLAGAKNEYLFLHFRIVDPSLTTLTVKATSKIMPINKKYSLKDNIEALKSYAMKTKTRITFEYVMLDGINDRDEDIKALARLMSTNPSKLNIIPFNSLEHMNPSGLAGQLRSTPIERIQGFADKLREKNFTVMLRNTQGDDIAAAC